MTRTARHARLHSHAWGRRSAILLLCLGACTLERAGQGHDAIREPAEETPSSEPQSPGSIDAGDAADAGDPDRVQDAGMAPGDAGGEPARDAGQPGKDAGPPGKDAGPPGKDAGPVDLCPADPKKIAPGVCGCGVVDCQDACPRDPAKRKPGVCGCGKPDADADSNGTPDCLDGMRRRAEVPSAKRAPVLA